MEKTSPAKLAVISMIGAFVIAGCSASAPPTILQQAHTNLQTAENDAQIAANAQLPLYEAKQSYLRAEQAWNKGEDESDVEHLAYLANQRVEIARQTAQQKAAEAETTRLAAERERVIVQARTREADAARQQAQISGIQAQTAQQEAQLAQKQAEARARELEQTRLQAQQVTEQNRKLEEQLSDLKARETQRGLEITLSNVLFDFDKASLKTGAERSLAPLVEFLKSNPQRTLTIEGHTDSVGSDPYNRQLSLQRAESVRDWFIQRGVDGTRITAQGLGKDFPVASNDTVAGRQENRRVQLIISTPETAGRLSRR